MNNEQKRIQELENKYKNFDLDNNQNINRNSSFEEFKKQKENIQEDFKKEEIPQKHKSDHQENIYHRERNNSQGLEMGPATLMTIFSLFIIVTTSTYYLGAFDFFENRDNQVQEKQERQESEENIFDYSGKDNFEKEQGNVEIIKNHEGLEEKEKKDEEEIQEYISKNKFIQQVSWRGYHGISSISFIVNVNNSDYSNIKGNQIGDKKDNFNFKFNNYLVDAHNFSYWSKKVYGRIEYDEYKKYLKCGWNIIEIKNSENGDVESKKIWSDNCKSKDEILKKVIKIDKKEYIEFMPGFYCNTIYKNNGLRGAQESLVAIKTEKATLKGKAEDWILANDGSGSWPQYVGVGLGDERDCLNVNNYQDRIKFSVVCLDGRGDCDRFNDVLGEKKIQMDKRIMENLDEFFKGEISEKIIEGYNYNNVCIYNKSKFERVEHFSPAGEKYKCFSSDQGYAFSIKLNNDGWVCVDVNGVYVMDADIKDGVTICK